jgi:hypothetical protein
VFFSSESGEKNRTGRVGLSVSSNAKKQNPAQRGFEETKALKKFKQRSTSNQH